MIDELRGYIWYTNDHYALYKLNDGGNKVIYEDSIKLLKRQGVEFETGLTIEEITKIEDIYTIKFPKSLKEFLMMTLPISKGFFNWRNLDQDNVMFNQENYK